MHYTPEQGSRKTDIAAARGANGSTQFINYGHEGEQPQAVGTLQGIWDQWKQRGVIGTSVVPHYKTTHPAYAQNSKLDATVSEALKLLTTHADEAAGILTVGQTAELDLGQAA